MCAHCHVVSIAIELTNLEAIKRACKRLGWKFKQGQTTYRWYPHGWQDDGPVPRHLLASDEEYEKVKAMTRPERIAFMNSVLGRCTHAIQVPGASYEIGLVSKGKAFVPAWDFWGTGGLKETAGSDLAQAYGVEIAKMTAEWNGHTVTDHVQQDGTIQVRVQIGDYQP